LEGWNIGILKYWVLKVKDIFFNHGVQNAKPGFQNCTPLVVIYPKIDRIPLYPLLQHAIIPIFQFNPIKMA